jgi:hypothetical protein
MIRTITRVWQRLVSSTRPQTYTVAPGIHIVANSPRHARWLWMEAVESEVSRSLMRSLTSTD